MNSQSDFLEPSTKRKKEKKMLTNTKLKLLSNPFFVFLIYECNLFSHQKGVPSFFDENVAQIEKTCHPKNLNLKESLQT